MSRSWIFYLLILVFLGGVIILIIYIRTLSANEKFSNKNNTNIIFIIIFLLTILLNSNFINNSFIFINYNFINHLYSSLNISSTIFLIFYLLITIICVVKLVKFEKGPLIKRL